MIPLFLSNTFIFIFQRTTWMFIPLMNPDGSTTYKLIIFK